MEWQNILRGEELMENGKKIIRCAIYCRKSVEKGLDMEFNSLDAQREAGEAYITSQKANGWVCLPEHYDDGGYSGGNMNRPALQKLLTDCKAGKVDVIVVYKIDRLSRSLFDFADLSRSFEKWNVAFVSVTQEINTNTSAGRMMLNILMTFAQFEREMIAMRVKDKIAATKKKGLWTGGPPPFGYQLNDKRLCVNEKTAPIVQRIFQRYIEIQSPKQIARELNGDGLTTNHGRRWDVQMIYRILNNYTYTGVVYYEGHTYPGEHEAIIDGESWDLTQRFLKANNPVKGVTPRRESDAALSGIIRCGHCNSAMTPTRSKRWGRVYHYYHCSKDLKGGESICPIKAIPAGEIENVVCEKLIPILQSSEIVEGIARQTGMQPQNIVSFFDGHFWEELTPVEKKRLMQILVDHVIVNRDSVVIEVRTENIKSVQEVQEANNEQDS